MRSDVFLSESCPFNGSAEFSVRATMGSKYAVGRRCTPSDIFWSVLHHPEKFAIMHARACMWHLCLIQGELYDLMNLRLLVARAEVMALVKTALFSVVLVALAPPLVAQPIEKKG